MIDYVMYTITLQGPLTGLFTLSFFVLSRQRLKMHVLDVDVET